MERLSKNVVVQDVPVHKQEQIAMLYGSFIYSRDAVHSWEVL